MEFFDPEGECTPSHDHIRAWHYFDHDGKGRDRWRRIHARAAEPSEYQSYRDAANKLSAHLTHTRIGIEEGLQWSVVARNGRRRTHQGKQPPSHDVTEYLLHLWTLFLRHLPAARFAWFEKEPLKS